MTGGPAFAADGAMILPAFAPPEILEIARAAFANADGRPGRRGFALASETTALVCPQGAMGQAAAALASRPMIAVRAIYFDKTPDANWAVPWHQDRTIAVKERVETPGFANWNVKDGIPHVEPPEPLLASMLTLRLFLDDCGPDDGPLEIALGTHALGRVPSAEAPGIARRAPLFVATGFAGDLLAMRLLCLHKSERAAKPYHRRVLHVDYAPGPLAEPLEWAGVS